MEQRLQLADIAAGLVRRNNMPAKEAEAFVRQFFDCIADNLFHDNIVKVKELGTFKVVGVEARESVDINTGQRILIEEHTKVSFTPDAVLRDAINKPFAEFQTVVLNENTPLEAMETFDDNDEPSHTDFAEAQDFVAPAQPEQQPKLEQEEQPAAAEPQSEEEQPAAAEPQPEEEQPAAAAPQPEEEQPAAAEPQPQEEQLASETEPEEQPTTAAPQPEEEQPAESRPEHSSVETDTPAPSEAPADTPAALTSEAQEPAVPRRRRGFWSVVFPVLLSILFFVVGYGIGYYRPVAMPDWQHLFASSKTEQGTQTATPKQPSQSGSSKTVKPSSLNNAERKVSPEAQNTKESTPNEISEQSSPTRSLSPSTQQASAQAEHRQPSEVLAYPQVEDGEYYIVGIKGTEVMRPGKTLLNISIKYYKSKDFVNYICTMNNIKNPDIVPLDMELKIPELKHK